MPKAARHPDRSLLDIERLSAKAITAILDATRRLARANLRKLAGQLDGRRVALLFYEPSTRTRVSFEFAAKNLGAITTLVSATASSIEKGESLIDTGQTLEALGADAIVIRHPSSGAPHLLARHVRVPVLNAGDGMHEHPSQALLDAYTMLQHKPSLNGLRVTMVGDIFHSRVARSNIHLLSKLGARVTLCGPPELLPEEATALAPGLTVERRMDAAIAKADVILMLRVQKERLAGLNLDLSAYIDAYQLNPDRLGGARRDVIVMHPGPIVRGVELTSDVADGARSVVLDQVRNGVLVRMAILLRALA